jgi:hypothetical protein
MADLTAKQFEAAKARGEETLRRGPLAVSVRYDHERNRIVVRLNTDAEIEFDPADAQGLESATPADLENVEIVEFGLGLHWPTLDADHWVPALAEGMLGSDRWMEQRRGSAARDRRAGLLPLPPKTWQSRIVSISELTKSQPPGQPSRDVTSRMPPPGQAGGRSAIALQFVTRSGKSRGGNKGVVGRDIAGRFVSSKETRPSGKGTQGRKR